MSEEKLRVFNDLRTDRNIIVEIGDVIDMTDTELVSTKSGHQFVRIVLRPENMGNVCQVFATAETAKYLVRGRITRIIRVYHYAKRLPRGEWYNNTDIVVDMEDAHDAEANLIATNSWVRPPTIKTAVKGDPNSKPTFKYGSKDNAKKED